MSLNVLSPVRALIELVGVLVAGILVTAAIIALSSATGALVGSMLTKSKDGCAAKATEQSTIKRKEKVIYV